MTHRPDHDQPRFGDFGEQAPTAMLAPTRLSLLAISSLVTGLLALPACCVPVVGSFFGLLPAVLGLGGLRAIRRSRGQAAGRSLAIAGLVMGLISFVASTLVWGVILSQFARMPAVYAQVLDEDPAVVRTIMTSSVATDITDEQIEQFRQAFIAEYGDTWTVQVGIGPMFKGYLAAGEPQALRAVPVGTGQSPVPLPVRVDGGWAYIVVVMQQGETLGSGLPALANAGFQAADGSVVWLVPHRSTQSNPPPPSQSPTPDPTDEQPGTPAPDDPGSDPDA